NPGKGQTTTTRPGPRPGEPMMQPITTAALDRILAFLAPFFLTGADGNPQAARFAAAETLQAYAARNEQELRLAAQIIAFSLRALDALARAAEPGLDLKAILRLNSSAVTLHRAAMRCQKEFDRLHAQPLPPDQLLPQEEIPAPEPPELLAFADAVRAGSAATPAEEAPAGISEAAEAAALPSVVPPLSRQQRRLAERLARREIRRHLPDHARQVERTLQSLRELEAAL
ncbi:MAG TPA: hypothetical protein VE690_17665, partial [Rhodopila sp.]|nr:hypothetical protein [Rhodopila sp.]